MHWLHPIVALCCASTVARAADSWSTPSPGIRRLHRTTTTQNINVLVVDLCKPGVSVRATKTGERQRTVSSFGALVGAQAAINGDFFSYADYGPTGPAMGDGAGWGGTDTVGLAPVQFGLHRVALPGQGGTAGVQPWARQVVSGHPSLIVSGVARNNTGDLCTVRHPRTGLGFSQDRKTLILAVVDGRATGRIGMTCAELGSLLAEHGAHDAVNLDGGGSSTMWLAGPGVVNVPSDGSQRVVSNHLAIRANGSGDAPHCPAPSYTASLTGAESPVELVSGEQAVVWLELDNTGDTAWKPDTTLVGTQDPEDRASVFFKQQNWVRDSRPAGVDMTTAPGATGRFTWAMVAPEVGESTTFDETFQLVVDGVAWFGPKYTMSITVHPTSGPTPGEGGTGDGAGDALPPEAAGCAAARAPGALGALVLVGLARVRRRVRAR